MAEVRSVEEDALRVAAVTALGESWLQFEDSLPYGDTLLTTLATAASVTPSESRTGPRSIEIDAAVAAIQSRIDEIRAAVPDIVPGGYQAAYADGMESALAEIRYAVTAVTPPAEHRLMSPPRTACCTCGWEPALGESIWRAFDKHIAETTIIPSESRNHG